VGASEERRLFFALGVRSLHDCGVRGEGRRAGRLRGGVARGKKSEPKQHGRGREHSRPPRGKKKEKKIERGQETRRAYVNHQKEKNINVGMCRKAQHKLGGYATAERSRN